MTVDISNLLKTPLYDLHLELGARMVPFAGYALPVQYKTGLMAEHKHTRDAVSLFDVSHMGQISVSGPQAASALESIIPADLAGLAQGHQRYGLLLGSNGGILDDLMVVNRGEDYFVIVNGACKQTDLAYLRERIGSRCTLTPLASRALLALQGPQAAIVMQRLCPQALELVFMRGGWFEIQGFRCHITRSGYTGEDGFELSVEGTDAVALTRKLLAEPEVKPAGLGARNSLRLEAGLCLYGSDMDESTTPAEAGLLWSIQKVRRTGGERAGNFPGATHVLAQIDKTEPVTRKRVGLVALERVPVREETVLQDAQGSPVGRVTSGLLAPTANKPIAMGYLPPDFCAPGTRVNALVRNKAVPMEVVTMPFVPTHYYRG